MDYFEINNGLDKSGKSPWDVVTYDGGIDPLNCLDGSLSLALKQASAGRVRALFLPRSGTLTALAAAAGVDVKFSHGTLLSVRWLSA